MAYGYRRRGYRRGRKKRRRYKKRVPRTMVSYNGVKNWKLRLSASIVTDALGNFNFHISPMNLTKHLSTSLGVVALDEATSLKALFDQYRVNAVKLKWIPTYLPGSQAAGDKDFLGSQPMIIMAYDPDNIGSIPAANLITRDRARFKGGYQHWNFYTKVKRGMQLQTADTGVVLMNGWNNIQTEETNNGGTVVFATNKPYTNGDGSALGNTPVATIIVTCYLQTKFRQ